MKNPGISGWVLSLLLPLATIAQASVTAAWKVPITWISPHHESDSRIHMLDKAPGESALLQPGDELWDVSGALDLRLEAPPGNSPSASSGEPADPFAAPAESQAKPSSTARAPGPNRDWKGDWLVWNARSGMVVGHGSWNDLLAAEKGIRFDQIPRSLRTTLRLKSKAGEQTLSLLAQNERSAGADFDGVSANISNVQGYEYTDLNLDLFWKSPESGRDWRISSAVIADYNREICIARKTQTPDAWEWFLTCHQELPDGTHMDQARLIEEDGKVSSWPHRPVQRKLADGRFADLSSLEIEKLGNFETEYPVIEAPPGVSDWIRGPVLDLRELFRKMVSGVSAPDLFAGQDPFTSRLIVVGSQSDVDLAEDLGATMGDSSSKVWVETNEQSGGWGLETQRGVKSGITCWNGETREFSFEIDPMVLSDVLDLSLNTDVLRENRKAAHFQAKLTIGQKDQEVRAEDIQIPGDAKVPLVLKARWKTLEMGRR